MLSFIILCFTFPREEYCETVYILLLHVSHYLRNKFLLCLICHLFQFRAVNSKEKVGNTRKEPAR